jgi:hypothetical protein
MKGGKNDTVDEDSDITMVVASHVLALCNHQVVSDSWGYMEGANTR